jgi:hypothetical protein
MAKEDEIRLIAYDIWEQEGYVNGKDCEHWFRAAAIWENRQKPKAIATNTKTHPKQIAQKTNKYMAAKKKT